MAACATLSTLYIGVRPAFELRFTDTDGDLVDPGTIVVRVKDPGGTVTTWTSPNATITTTSTGVWVFQFPSALTVAGKWWLYVVASGGGADAANEIGFTLHGSHVPAP